MQVSELIEQLKTVNPAAEVILFGTDSNREVGGIYVTDNDDDTATEIAVCTKEFHDSIFKK